MSEIIKMIRELAKLDLESYHTYSALVTEITAVVYPEKEVECILDKLVNFCEYDKNEDLFRSVCETYRSIYPEMVDFQLQQLEEFLDEN